MTHVTSFCKFTPVCAACLLLALALGGCSTVENFMGGDKVDYRSAAVKTNGLDVPPDLTQLARDTRYQQPGGTVSAATFQSGQAQVGASPVATVVVASASDVRLERLGTERWLAVAQPPERVWPQLQAFWKERGMVLVVQ